VSWQQIRAAGTTNFGERCKDHVAALNFAKYLRALGKADGAIYIERQQQNAAGKWEATVKEEYSPQPGANHAMTEPQFDQAKMDSYQLFDAEVERLNQLVAVYIADVMSNFGERAHIALVNCLGSALAHNLLDPDEAFYVMTKVNDWLAESSRNHAGLPLQLAFDEKLIEKAAAP
jgi:hypothetical protein